MKNNKVTIFKHYLSLFLSVAFLTAQTGQLPLAEQKDTLAAVPEQEKEVDVVSSATDSVYQPDSVPVPDSVRAYLIEPGDVLQINILGEEELSGSLVVWHNGRISLPLIGDIKVSGLTTEQAADSLTIRLKKYYAYPVVSVILKSPTLAYVSVYGSVLKPGTISYEMGFRVTDYIALAGGPTDKANLGNVRVIRFQGEIPTVTIVNVDEIIKKGLVDQNFELKSGDWLYVGQRFSINWGFILQLATLALTATHLYITINNL